MLDIFGIATIAGLFVGIPSAYGYVTFIKHMVEQHNRNKSKSLILKRKKDWIIIAPRYANNYQRKEDVMAANLIRDWCKSLGVNCTIKDDGDPIPPDANLFFICGPKANKKVSHYYQGLNFVLEDINGYVIIDQLGGQTYHSRMSSSDQDQCDYAILARTVDKSNNRYFIFCMGIKAHGTLGAAHMLTTCLANSISKDIKPKDTFESVVSVPYIDDYCSIANVSFIVPPRS